MLGSSLLLAATRVEVVRQQRIRSNDEACARVFRNQTGWNAIQMLPHVSLGRPSRVVTMHRISVGTSAVQDEPY